VRLKYVSQIFVNMYDIPRKHIGHIFNHEKKSLNLKEKTRAMRKKESDRKEIYVKYSTVTLPVLHRRKKSDLGTDLSLTANFAVPNSTKNGVQ